MYACISPDSTNCLIYMQGCHLTGRYKECSSVYNKLLNKFHQSDLSKAKLLKAKSLYYIYIDDQMELHEDVDVMTPKVLSQTLEKCYENVKELILLLEEFIDDVSFKDDNELQTMLDSAMMDYMHKTNKLYEINRCYLCYKKVGGKSPEKSLTSCSPHSLKTDDDMPNVTGMYEDLTIKEEISSVQEQKCEILELPSHGVKQKRGSQASTLSIDRSDAEIEMDVPSSSKRMKYLAQVISKKANLPRREKRLIKSHIFPKSILERFAHAVPFPNDLRVISHIPSLAMKQNFQQKLVSPGSLTLFMLCSSCENIISSHGETQFLPELFDKFYDPKDPSKSTGEQVIEYGPELYNFCIGLIFRTLYWSKGKYTNENELYQLLQQCRQYLLKLQSKLMPNPEDMPEVFLLISPLSVEESELKHGFMNSVLSGTCFAIAANNNLSTGDFLPRSFIQLQYFLIHLGAINILVKLTPSKDFELPMQFHISPQCGSYHIPPESARKALLPQGILSIFQLLAQINEKKWLEAPESIYRPFEKKAISQPAASVAAAYGIMSGRESEVDQSFHIQPSPNPSTPKVIDFMPSQFFVRPYQQPMLELPPGHRILLHETAGDSLSGNTIFIVLDVSHSGNKPYVIWHYYNQGIQINFGFFITASDSNLEVGDFLVSTKEKFRVEHFQEVMKTKSNACNILPGVLRAKGFFNLQSLLNRITALRYVTIIQSCINVIV